MSKLSLYLGCGLKILLDTIVKSSTYKNYGNTGGNTVIQAKVVVGHRVWDSYVWNFKLPTQIYIYIYIYIYTYDKNK